MPKSVNLPPATPSHRWGRVMSLPKLPIPPIGQEPPGGSGGVSSVPEAVNQLALQTPDFFPIPTATEFQIIGQALTTAAGIQAVVASNAALIAAIDLPTGSIGIIRSFTIGVATAITTTTNQLFQILFNGSVVYTRSFAGRNATNLEISFDTALRIPNGAIVSMQINNLDGGTYTDTCSCTGWFYTIADGLRWVKGQGAVLFGV